MDKELKQSMLTYYDERAAEYDEIHTLGRGSTIDPKNIKDLGNKYGMTIVVHRFGRAFYTFSATYYSPPPRRNAGHANPLP